MAWCRLADSHNPNRSPEQCLQTQSYVIIRPRLKLVNFTTLLLALTVNGTGRPGTQRSTGHCVSVSGRPAAQRPTGHCVAGHPGTQRPIIGHCVAGHPGTQSWTGHCVAGHPGTQRSTAHCVAGTRVHSIAHLIYLWYIAYEGIDTDALWSRGWVGLRSASLVVCTIGNEERPPEGQHWMEQYLTRDFYII